VAKEAEAAKAKGEEPADEPSTKDAADQEGGA
jgi:hypothetical protein